MRVRRTTQCLRGVCFLLGHSVLRLVRVKTNTHPVSSWFMQHNHCYIMGTNRKLPTYAYFLLSAIYPTTCQPNTYYLSASTSPRKTTASLDSRYAVRGLKCLRQIQLRSVVSTLRTSAYSGCARRIMRMGWSLVAYIARQRKLLVLGLYNKTNDDIPAPTCVKS